MLLFIAFFVSINSCLTTQISDAGNNDVGEIPKKEEFRKWFENIRNIHYDGCDSHFANGLSNNETHKTFKKDKQKVLTVVNCSSGRGKPNYKIMFLDAIDNALPKSFNGSFILKFGSYYDLRYIDGLKTGKCIEVADFNVNDIRGYFVNDVLKGKAVIGYGDGSQTVMCNDNNGNVIGNKRKFKQSINHSESYILETIEDYKGEPLLTSSPIDRNVMLLSILQDKKMIITFSENDSSLVESIYHCGNGRQYCYLDCFEIKEALITVMDNFEFRINSTSDITKQGNKSFLIDVMSYESKFHTSNNTPGCKEIKINDLQSHDDVIHNSIKHWIKFMSNENYDPFWVKNCEEEINKPFNITNPKLHITVPYLNNRKGLRNGNIEIYAHNDKKVYRGRLKNGELEEKMYVPPGQVVCSFKSLGRVVKHIGKRIQTIKGKNITFEDCQKLCFETKECQSFGYCTFAQNCHLFDKKLDGSEELKPPNGCFTTYKICKDDLEEAAEFNFDWSSNLKMNIKIGQPSNLLKCGHFRNTASTSEKQISIHAKMEDNYINGLIRIFGRVPVHKYKSCGRMIEPGLSFIGRFEDGKPTGICWRGLIGGAWLYGKVDEIGEFTGDQIAYIYPDLRTCLLGKFRNGTMISTKEARIVGSKCNEDGIKTLSFITLNSSSYHYDPPSNTSLGSHLLQDDPLDIKYVKVEGSNTSTNLESGLFSKMDIPENTSITLYNGMVFNKGFEQELLINENRKVLTEFMKTEKNATKVIQYSDSINNFRVHSGCGQIIHIPAEYGSIKYYRKTLGHMVKHSFNPNSIFQLIDSARFGLIQMIVSIEEIPKGNEITVNYGYPFASGPLWYKILMKKSIQKNPRLWRSDPNLYKLFENVNIFKWNETNEYVLLNLSNTRVRRR